MSFFRFFSGKKKDGDAKKTGGKPEEKKEDANAPVIEDDDEDITEDEKENETEKKSEDKSEEKSEDENEEVQIENKEKKEDNGENEDDKIENKKEDNGEIENKEDEKKEDEKKEEIKDNEADDELDVGATLKDKRRRPRYLKKKLITQYKANKEAAKKEMLERLTANAPKKENNAEKPAANGDAADVVEEAKKEQNKEQEQEQNLEQPQNQEQNPAPKPLKPLKPSGGETGFEKANRYIAAAGTGAAAVNAAWSAGDAFADIYAADAMKPVDRLVNNFLGFTTSAVGAAENTTKLIANHQKRGKTKDKTKRTAMRWDSLKNTISLLGNVSKMGGAVTGFAFDTKENELAGKVSKGLSTATTSLNFLSSLAGMGGTLHGSLQRRLVSRKLGKLAMKEDPENTERTAKEAKNNAKDINEYEASRAEHKSIKAKKYAVQQAHEFQKNKTGRYWKGSLSTGVSALTTAASLAGTFWEPMSSSNWGKVIKGLIPAVSLAAKFAEKKLGKMSDNRIKKKSGQIRADVLNKYLAQKRDKVRADANNAVGQGTELTDNEADRITVGRLGVNVTVKDEPLSSKQKDNAFERLNLKRAQNILDSSEKDKNSILDALKLDRDASVEDVAKALKGE